jgi:hypothetical protein
LALDLARTALQIDDMALAIRERDTGRRQRLRNAASAIGAFDVERYEALRAQNEASIRYPAAIVLEQPNAAYDAPALPDDFCVAAADGSHIDADRHMPAHCYLINIGTVTLTYGAHPDAQLASHPRLYAQDDELVVFDETTGQSQAIEGAVLSAKRAAEEVKALAELARGLPSNTPTLALTDGSLAYIGLTAGKDPHFVVRELLEEGFVAALRELQQLAQGRRLAVAGYISLPNADEVVGALRLAGCGYSVEGSRRCAAPGASRPPCETCVGGLRDRDVFTDILETGQRSAVFGSSSGTVAECYGDQAMRFFYLNAGPEIARVDVPAWVAGDADLLDLTHALVLDQCRRGPGYPIALMEAHEQAVVSGGDRQRFTELVEQALQNNRLPVTTSEKNRSKRLRWL